MGGGEGDLRAGDEVLESLKAEEVGAYGSFFSMLVRAGHCEKSRRACTYGCVWARGPTGCREAFIGCSDGRTRVGTSLDVALDTCIIVLDLDGRHKHQVLVATQDGGLVESCQGMGCTCVRPFFAVFERER